MGAREYEFVFRASRASLWFAFVGSLLTIALGTALVVVPLGPAFRLRLPAAGTGVGAAMVASGALLVAVAAVVLRRSLIHAHDCRIGEAGIYLRTLLRAETYVPWVSFLDVRYSGRIARLIFRGADGNVHEVWIETPRGHEAEYLRLRTFLAERAGAAGS